MTFAREVTTWYLEMLSPSELRPARRPTAEHRIEQVVQPNAAFARYLYSAVGGDWHWTDRLAWSKQHWDDYLARPGLQLHTLVVGGAPAGYVELETQPGDHVQLVYFGLIAERIGQGFGGWLLTRAAQLAWQIPETRRVWVHTCTLDGPAALGNYQARGFRIYRTEVKPGPGGAAPGPWPGWDRNNVE
jgi:GNAT superfamily N-acetyltransferase